MSRVEIKAPVLPERQKGSKQRVAELEQQVKRYKQALTRIGGLENDYASGRDVSYEAIAIARAALINS